MSVKIIPKEHWEILMKYLDDSGVVLISEEFMKENNLTEDDIYACGSDYNFGGEADIWVDKVNSKEHLFIAPMFENN